MFGEQIASVRQEREKEGPVMVDFANGVPASEYDLVVACDGTTSRTRAMGFGGSVHDHIEPINAWSAFFSIDDDLINGSNVGHGFSAVRGRFISIERNPAGANVVTLQGKQPRD